MNLLKPQSETGANKQQFRLVLASNSPRRKDLLKNLGLNFEVMPSNVDESFDPKLPPAEVVTILAEAKAREIGRRLNQTGTSQPTIIVGSDTLVVLDNKIFGQPKSQLEAVQMLKQLSGRQHTVYTAVSLLKLPEQTTSTACDSSKVFLRHLQPAEIEAYVQTGEPMDKAGAYALQGIGAALVEKVEGCVTNIIGLPVPVVVRLLRESGVKILGCP